jgi:hypothetical protein
VVLYYARWLVVVLAAARERFQEKDLGAKLFPSCLLAFRYRCENLARLPDGFRARTAMSGGNLSQTGGVLASRVCFEPALFKDAHKKKMSAVDLLLTSIGFGKNQYVVSGNHGNGKSSVYKRLSYEEPYLPGWWFSPS